jgi:Ca2+-binding RTX toxin-like protein
MKQVRIINNKASTSAETGVNFNIVFKKDAYQKIINNPSKIQFSISGNDLVIRLPGTGKILTLLDFRDNAEGNGVPINITFVGHGKTIHLRPLIHDFFTQTGTSTDDRLFGSEWSDTQYGLAGHDTIWGAGGNDVIYCGNGNDIAYGGNGNDTLYGGQGNDYLRGEEDPYARFAAPGNDYLVGGAGNDTLSAQWGNDTLFGGDGKDTFFIEENASGTVRIKDFIGIDDTLSLPSFWKNIPFKYVGSDSQISLTYESRVTTIIVEKIPWEFINRVYRN